MCDANQMKDYSQKILDKKLNMEVEG